MCVARASQTVSKHGAGSHQVSRGIGEEVLGQLGRSLETIYTHDGLYLAHGTGPGHVRIGGVGGYGCSRPAAYPPHAQLAPLLCHRVRQGGNRLESGGWDAVRAGKEDDTAGIGHGGTGSNSIGNVRVACGIDQEHVKEFRVGTDRSVFLGREGRDPTRRVETILTHQVGDGDSGLLQFSALGRREFHSPADHVEGLARGSLNGRNHSRFHRIGHREQNRGSSRPHQSRGAQSVRGEPPGGQHNRVPIGPTR